MRLAILTTMGTVAVASICLAIFSTTIPIGDVPIADQVASLLGTDEEEVRRRSELQSRAVGDGEVQASATPSSAEPPRPFTTSAGTKVYREIIEIHGVRINIALRNKKHMNFINNHVWRELNGYALLKDAIEHARARDPAVAPLVMDVGSNHGLFALFAAKLGADVIALEPQQDLCGVINSAAEFNGGEVASRITLYNNAVLDSREKITLAGIAEGEGAVATVVREGGSGGGADKIEARPIADFVPATEKRDICFVKVDVEGFELHALPSAAPLFFAGRVHNVLVEFGPPDRWSVASNTAADGVSLLHNMQHTHNFEPRLINSYVWEEYLSQTDDETKNLAKERKWVPLYSGFRQQEVVDSMTRGGKNGESYVWFTQESKTIFEVFSSNCAIPMQQVTVIDGKQRLRRAADGVVSLGCDGKESVGNGIIQRAGVSPGTSDPPRPYTSFAQQIADQQSMYIHGVRIDVVLRDQKHWGLIKAHVFREINGYALLKDAIEQARVLNSAVAPLVIDVGSNHGLFALFAAKLGADVIALEPQRHLCDVINTAARLNGEQVSSRITLYNNAVLDSRETITLAGAAEGEGAVATVVREGATGGGADKIEARPIVDFVPATEKRDICFLKVDVEGFELHALPSAAPLFSAGRVHNVLVEFGPPDRWSVASNTAADGVKVLNDMQKAHGFEPRLIDSWVWDEYLSQTDDEAKKSAKEKKMVPLDSSFRQQEIVDAMVRGGKTGESYVWFTRDAEAKYEVFSSDCAIPRQGTTIVDGKKRLRRTPDGIITLGCDKRSLRERLRAGK